MPMYDYECKQCNTVTEVIHKHDDKHEKCDKCGGEVTRLFTGKTVIKYGCGGFYNTDYKPQRKD